MPARRVLVTGVSRDLGGALARLLSADPSIETVVGVDTHPPREDIGRAQFLRADIRNPLIAKVITSSKVDTVVHMNVLASSRLAGGRAAMKEVNVIGTMQLLAACQKAPSIRTLVLKSTTSVYGRSPRDPAVHVEDDEPRSIPATGYARTPSRSRATSAASAVAGPTSRSRSCGSRTSSGRASTRRSPSTSACRSRRRSSAPTRGCR